jgi:hypothetical protein
MERKFKFIRDFETPQKNSFEISKIRSIQDTMRSTVTQLPPGAKVPPTTKAQGCVLFGYGLVSYYVLRSPRPLEASG